MTVPFNKEAAMKFVSQIRKEFSCGVSDNRHVNRLR